MLRILFFISTLVALLSVLMYVTGFSLSFSTRAKSIVLFCHVVFMMVAVILSLLNFKLHFVGVKLSLLILSISVVLLSIYLLLLKLGPTFIP